MSLLIALAISIGGFALIATWLFLNPLAVFHMQVWQAFIAWASFFHNGGKKDGITKTVICMSAGAVIGMGSVMLAGQLGALGSFAAPVAVGIGSVVMVLISHFPLTSTIPSTVYGFGSVAGLILLGKDMTPASAIVPTIASIILGACFGWLSEYVGGKLAKS
jgi:hypothetical protein